LQLQPWTLHHQNASFITQQVVRDQSSPAWLTRISIATWVLTLWLSARSCPARNAAPPAGMSKELV
jgi:hypothetical protein